MKKVIILDTTKANYENGRAMVSGAISLTYLHGFWDSDLAIKVFGEEGWLKPYDELMSLNDFKKKVKKGEI